VVKKLRSNRGAGEPVSLADVDHVAGQSRLADLAHPDNFCRSLARGVRPATYRSTPRLLPIASGEAAARIGSLWQRLPAWTTGGISVEDAGFLTG